MGDFGARWHEEAEEVISGMKEWRLQHPCARLREIEQALDERLGKMRARLLQDAALASAATGLAIAETGARLPGLRGGTARSRGAGTAADDAPGASGT